jgi:uncharacterized repeat protein (TIGR03803 family)
MTFICKMQPLLFCLALCIPSAAWAQLPQTSVADSFQLPLARSFVISQQFKVFDTSTTYGPGFHLGEDFFISGSPGPMDVPVLAAGNGIVKDVNSYSGYGHIVIIEHQLPAGDVAGPTVTTLYGHMGSLGLISSGATVQKGDIIGFLSGDKTQNGGYPFTHLHFEVRKGPFATGCDPTSNWWVYAGYSTLFRVCGDANTKINSTSSDPQHAIVVSHFLDPEVFISSRGRPSTINPVPVITSLVPATLPVASSSRNLVLNGTNFLGSTLVTFNGVPQAVSFMNAGQLAVSLTASDVSQTGSFPIIATNPGPGGGSSKPVNFVVNNPAVGPIVIAPTSLSVPQGGSQTLSAAVAHSQEGVTWTIAEGAAGGVLVNADSTSVVYLPPTSTGTFHVVANSIEAPSLSATATIIVGPPISVQTIFTFRVTGAGPSGNQFGNGFGPIGELIQGLAPDDSFYGAATGGGDYSVPGCSAGGCGTIFKIDASGNFSLRHSFQALDGAGPSGGLIISPDGTLYGITADGGHAPNCVVGDTVAECGTIYKLNTANSLTTLHDLSSADGIFPQDGLVLGADGNFYGTAFNGGNGACSVPGSPTPGCGAIFRVDSSGNFLSLHLFQGTDGASPFARMLQASNQNFYGTTEDGGTAGDGTVFKIDPAGHVIILHHFTGLDGAFPDAGLVQGLDGFFYGNTLAGGNATNALGTIFKIDPVSGALTTIHTFTGPDGELPTVRMTRGNDGILYGVTFAGGAGGLGTVFRLDNSGNITILHSFRRSDGAFPASALVLGRDGKFYGATFNGGPDNGGVIYSLSVP